MNVPAFTTPHFKQSRVVSESFLKKLSKVMKKTTCIHFPNKMVRFMVVPMICLTLGRSLSYAHPTLEKGTIVAKVAVFTISGEVTGASNEPIAGVNVLLKGTTKGVLTDANGKYRLAIEDSEKNGILVFSFVGYDKQEVSINGQTTLNITLKEGSNLEEVVVSASKKAEKVQDAPASVSVLGARQLSVSPDIDPTRTLGNMPGVTIQQQSASKINIEMRGTNSNFLTSVFPILDYRNLVSAGVGTFNSATVGLNTIDLDRIEVVRGPGSALYGAGVTSGVVHYISKSPIDRPGTTVELIGGELSTFGMNARHATKVSDQFGFKINAMYRRGNDFTLDPKDSTDVKTIAALKKSISKPTIVNDRIDIFGQTTQVVPNLDTDGDGNPMPKDYYNLSLNTTLEFRPTKDLSFNLSGGYNDFKSVYWTNQGEGLRPGSEVWTQARMQYKGLFAQVFYSSTKAKFDAALPAVGYRSGLITGIDNKGLESQIQYNFQVKNKFDITTGFDTRQAFSDSRNLTYGRYEKKDDYFIYGGYLQGKWAVSPKLNVLAAGRYDGFNFLDKGFFSPRAALVFKPTAHHTLRASYNLAGQVPNAVNMFLDLPAAPVVPGLMDIWVGGQKTPHILNGNNSNMDVTIPGFPNLPLDAKGMPLAFPYLAVNQAILDVLRPNLGADPLGIANFLKTFVPAGTTGNLYGWNIFEGPQTPLAVQNNNPATVTKFATYELGYSGFIKNKWRINLDIYNTSITNGFNFTAVAPVYSLLGADSGAGLYKSVGDALSAYLKGKGLSDADINKIVYGDPANPAVPGIAQIYAGAGKAFDDPVTGAGGLYPVFGAAESQSGVVPLDDNIVHIAGADRISPDTYNYTGIDLGTQYYFREDIIGYFNYSWLSKNEWKLGDKNVTVPYNLNTPKTKIRMGLQYLPAQGFSGSISFQHTPSYNATFGLYSGKTDEQNLIDLNLGYGFNNGLKFSFNVTNLFNSTYRYAPAMPKIGRIALGKLTYTFGGK
jgi:outer membrane receptor for ferrienterochelin and colicins